MGRDRRRDSGPAQCRQGVSGRWGWTGRWPRSAFAPRPSRRAWGARGGSCSASRWPRRRCGAGMPPTCTSTAPTTSPCWRMRCARRHPDGIRLGAEVVGYAQSADGIGARLAGGEEVSGDVLIGADGIHSPGCASKCWAIKSRPSPAMSLGGRWCRCSSSAGWRPGRRPASGMGPGPPLRHLSPAARRAGQFRRRGRARRLDPRIVDRARLEGGGAGRFRGLAPDHCGPARPGRDALPLGAV